MDRMEKIEKVTGTLDSSLDAISDLGGTVLGAITQGQLPDAAILTTKLIAVLNNFTKGFLPNPFGTGAHLMLAIAHNVINSEMERAKALKLIGDLEGMFLSAIDEANRVLVKTKTPALKKALTEFIESTQKLNQMWAAQQMINDGWKGVVFNRTLGDDFLRVKGELEAWRKELEHQLLVETHSIVSDTKDSIDNIADQVGALFKSNNLERQKQVLALLTPDFVENENRFSMCVKEHVPGTFENHIQQFTSWFSDPNGTPGKWIQALPGLGKSILVTQIGERVSRLPSKPNVAYFFCERGVETTMDPLHAVKSLCYQLAKKSVQFAEALDENIIADQSRSSNLEVAFRNLLVEPLKQVTHPVLVVIDSVMAFSDSDNANSFFSQLLSFPKSTFNNNVRWLIASRPMPSESNFFEHVVLGPESLVEDNKIYVEARLKPFCPGQVDNSSSYKLFETMVNAVLIKSQGVFLHSRLLCDAILDEFLEQMDTDPVILKTEFIHFFDQLNSDLSSLEPLFDNAIASCQKACKFFDEIFFMVLAAQTPISVNLLGIFLKASGSTINVSNIPSMLKKCRIFVVSSADIISIFSTSLKEYLPRSQHYKDTFSDKIKETHTKLASICIDFMKTGLTVPYSRNAEDLAVVRESVPLELQYACLFWDEHLAFSNISHSLSSSLAKFFSGNNNNGAPTDEILFWLDILALFGNVPALINAVVRISNIFEANDVATSSDFAIIDVYCKELKQLLYGNSAILHDNPRELYRSVLMFAPTESNIYKRFAKRYLENGYGVVLGFKKKWDVRLATLTADTKITLVDSSPAGELVGYATEDFKCAVWFSSFGKHSGLFEGHTAKITCVEAWDTRSTLITGSMDKTVRLWDIYTGEPLFVFTAPYGVEAITFTESGKVVVALSGGILSIFSCIPDVTFPRPPEFDCEITCILLTARSNRLLCGLKDGRVAVWYIKLGKFEFLKDSHSDKVNALVLSSNGSIAVSVGEDSKVLVWSITDDDIHLLHSIKSHHAPIVAVSMDRYLNTILVTSNDLVSRVLDSETGKTLRVSRVETVNPISFIDNNAASQTVTYVSEETGYAYVFDATVDGSEKDIEKMAVHDKLKYGTSNVHFSETGNILGGLCDDRTSCQLWHLPHLLPLKVLLGAPQVGLTMSDTGSIVVVYSKQGFTVWTSEGELISDREKDIGSGVISKCEVSADGNRVLVQFVESDTASLWDIRSGIVGEFKLDEGYITSSNVSADGCSVVLGSSNGDILYIPDVMEPVNRVPHVGHVAYITSLVIEKELGVIISSTCKGMVHIREFSGKIKYAFSTDMSVKSVHLSPDSKKLICLEDQPAGCAKMYSVESSRTIQIIDSVLSVPVGKSSGIAFNPITLSLSLFDWDNQCGDIYALPDELHSYHSAFTNVLGDKRYIWFFGDKTINISIPIEPKEYWSPILDLVQPMRFSTVSSRSRKFAANTKFGLLDSFSFKTKQPAASPSSPKPRRILGFALPRDSSTNSLDRFEPTLHSNTSDSFLPTNGSQVNFDSNVGSESGSLERIGSIKADQPKAQPAPKIDPIPAVVDQKKVKQKKDKSTCCF
ncbi:hypothetical protein BC833DRAFT_575422 [Globomyces pollinis-pini]|nr:hypothetical protein BC833DRAFT_575422 [Globomyces pollinis-pini]